MGGQGSESRGTGRAALCSMLPEPVCAASSAFCPLEMGAKASRWIDVGDGSPAEMSRLRSTGPTEHPPHMTGLFSSAGFSSSAAARLVRIRVKVKWRVVKVMVKGEG